MEKRPGKISLISDDQELIYTTIIKKKEDKLFFELPDNSENIFIISKKELIRETKDFYLQISFSTTNSSIYLKDLKKEIPLIVELINEKTDDNEIEFEYILNDEKYILKIEIGD